MTSPKSPDHEPKRHSRRNLLLATGAGLAGATIGAGGAAADAELLAPEPQTGATIPPSEALMREHGVLARTLLIYRETERRLRAIW